MTLAAEIHVDAVNRAATFLPQTTEDEKPALRVGDALVFAYITEDDGGNLILRVTVDLDDVEGDVPSGVQLAIGGDVVYDA